MTSASQSALISSMTDIDFDGELVEVSCPLCCDPPAASLVYRDEANTGFWQCNGCNLIYASPRYADDALLRIYEDPAFFAPSFEREWTYAQWRRSSSRAYLHARVKIDLVAQYLSMDDWLLDVGCGHGLTLAEGAERGLKCQGIDPSFMLTRHAKERFKVDAIQTTIDRFEPGRLFKGVLVWDVLEHVAEPATILGHAHRLLQEGGFLFLQVPNHRGLSNRWKTLLCQVGLRRKFSHFGFPWHIYSFDPVSLKTLMEGADFEVELIESWSGMLKKRQEQLLLSPDQSLDSESMLG